MMNGPCNTELQSSIKKTSIIKLFFLNFITAKIYWIFLFLKHAKSIQSCNNRKVPPLIYGLALASACVQIYFVFNGKISPTEWSLLPFFFIPLCLKLWLSRILAHEFNIELSPNKISRFFYFIFLDCYYLQYKLNLIAKAKELPTVVSNDKWLNRIVIPVSSLLLIIATMRAFFINWYHVPEVSMTPNIIPGDRVLTNRRALKNIEDVHYGDLIVFQHPENPSLEYIKRVVGKPGDKIKIRDNDLYVNDVLQRKKLTQISDKTNRLSHVETDYSIYQEIFDQSAHEIIEQNSGSVHRYRTFPKEGVYIVSKESFFVLGDFRDNSVDSRAWGAIPFNNIKGKVILVIWSKEPGLLTGSIRKDRFLLPIN